ncbi:hypothetical protein BRD09_06595 [Halobacteriales archaeon SW_10_68_16]|nr:MAG: hypothetical protein BRD09_06595 [Halobacteriales archaeon SW_10_68_16]
MSDEGRPAADGGEAATANRTFEEGTLAELADGVVTLDADWTVTDANDAAREILGAGASGLVGADVREAFPEGAWLEGRFAAVLDAGEATTVEVDGGERDTLLEVRVHPTENGHSDGSTTSRWMRGARPPRRSKGCSRSDGTGSASNWAF